MRRSQSLPFPGELKASVGHFRHGTKRLLPSAGADWALTPVVGLCCVQWHHFVECDNRVRRIWRLSPPPLVPLYVGSQWMIVSRDFVQYLTRDLEDVSNSWSEVVDPNKTFASNFARYAKVPDLAALRCRLATGKSGASHFNSHSASRARAVVHRNRRRDLLCDCHQELRILSHARCVTGRQAFPEFRTDRHLSRTAMMTPSANRICRKQLLLVFKTPLFLARDTRAVLQALHLAIAVPCSK